MHLLPRKRSLLVKQTCAIWPRRPDAVQLVASCAVAREHSSGDGDAAVVLWDVRWALMLQLIDRATRASRRTDSTAAVMFIDLDRFKEVNDTYGHRVGDELLMAVAQRLTELLRPGDSLARMSGDEFLLSTNLSTLIQHQAQSTGSQLPALAASTTSPSTADRVLRLAGGQTPARRQ
jgi:diguanylate cyclase (GGDEF)-like protein